ncbi:galacturonosyltransferase [Halobacillus karajensis]|uniref:glycosyltransferase family 4 protein n=1 Tax=Halobacillus karajensis TaxID=195088 RepID=UPI0008A7A4A8|nr:glycosyltransferase family 4 protein [Halobacillus karajensis]SEH44032.1 galacturonosyltransferase [Halobacillus karajensis]
MKVLVLANFGMGLYKFRKELLEELISRGDEVVIALPNDNLYVPKLRAMGCEFIDTNVDRRGTNPASDLILLISYISILKNVNPDIVLTYTIKPNIYGGIACRLMRKPYIVNVTGLGTSVENKGLMQRIVLNLYKQGLRKAKSVFFQNRSNMDYFLSNKLVNSKVNLIPGSGVNLQQNAYQNYPDVNEKVNFLFVGRIMKAKGINELLEAAQYFKHRNLNVSFNIVGPSEEGYADKLNDLNDKGIINYYGQRSDIQEFMKKAHAIILPSYHEGTSNVLLESAATGRPVLASNIPGCKETFDEGVSGLGFKAKDVASLIETINDFIELPHKQKKDMGVAARNKMEKEYDRQIVIQSYLNEIGS